MRDGVRNRTAWMRHRMRRRATRVWRTAFMVFVMVILGEG
jgi:hypothetical protein